MKRLRSHARGVFVVCRRGALLGAMGAVLMAPAAFAGPPQRHRHPHPHASPPAAAAATTVNFRQNALFTCNGAFGGAAVPTDTATISSTVATVSATVRVVAPPGTFVSGQLTQGFCLRLAFFSFTVGPTGIGTTTVTDLRVSNRAFVWIVEGGRLEITPSVGV
jgi:hypothetical protein